MIDLRRRNLKVVAGLAAVIGMMVILVAFSVPLYRLFCAATGYGGTTRRAESDTTAVSDRTITVRFDINVAPGLPWRFEPLRRDVTVHLGEQKLVLFSAENLADTPIVGHATYNVTPQKTGLYFNKTQCFCFDDERLGAHQKVDMPVVFFVDPALATDLNTRDVETITLSYTFFRSPETDRAKDLSRLEVSATSDPRHGQELFAERCAACHALDHNKLARGLGGVFDRKAGANPGYDYSPALRQAGLTWSADNLDRWRAGPRDFVPGARMPVRVGDPKARRDIIACLEQESRAAKSTAAAADPAPQHASTQTP